jgi:sulfite exporter TauE/SafE
MQGFLLDLANGMTCLAFCAPVLVPFLLEQGEDVRQNLVMLLKFLGGRLGGYMLFGLFARATGSLLLPAISYQGLVIGMAYVGLSTLLLVAVLLNQGPAPGACAFEGAQARLSRWPALLPVGMGLLAGLKVCPPLLLAIANAASTGTLGGSLLLFMAFFLGTSVYFLPISLLGALTRVPDLRIVGRFAAVIVALHYLYSGILLLAGGLKL